MKSRLDRLAETCGILRRYRSIDGRMVDVPEAAVMALLQVLGCMPRTVEEPLRAPLPARRKLPRRPRVPEGAVCHLPQFLETGRAWGVSCQLYSLCSERNWGIGDFEDLARLGELMAFFGADFLGVNPLHALFLAHPEAASPFSPSDRSHLNPLYIAPDQVEGFEPGEDLPPESLAVLRKGELVDYRAVSAAKLRALRAIHARLGSKRPSHAEADFIAEGGEALRRHALFEAISTHMTRQGHEAGWFSWPEAMRNPDSAEVADFARRHAEEVDFHLWLQWLADSQLADVARRLQAAGMRIGLYLDLAVGAAPDGSATWRDRSLTVVGAEIGAPPDMFNPEGQKWGLAPVSPTELAARNFEPARRIFRATMRHAGALRIDHAMSLHRLFWIPDGFPADAGAYVFYPMEELVRGLADVSRERETIVIGEDLGVVPHGFRSAMERARMLGYRVFYFEQERGGFIPPARWPKNALACVGSHDTATLAGWWNAEDIAESEVIGLHDAAQAVALRQQRENDRRSVARLLDRFGELVGEGEAFDIRLAAGVHRVVASTPSRLMAVQLEDLLGIGRQVNIPGTSSERANWCHRLPVPIERLGDHAMLRAVLGAIAGERPRQP